MHYPSLVFQQAYALGEPAHSGVFRQQPQDFRVHEILGFDPAGEGDHVMLQVTKVGLNTHDIVERLVQRLNVRQVDVGYCGLKDRHAITCQWFSVHVPGRAHAVRQELIQTPQLGEGARVDTCSQHLRKLRPGIHQANHFELSIQISEDAHNDLTDRLERTRTQGFPNYFGEQRFGHGCRNLDRARAMLLDNNNRDASRRRARKPSRSQRSLYLSAARGFIFNQILSSRIRVGNWLTALPGEPLMLAGTQSFFIPDTEDLETSENRAVDSIEQRLGAQDLHTTGALWGRSDKNPPLNFELDVAEPFSDLAQGLEQAGLVAARRALRAVPHNVRIAVIDHTTVNLSVELNSGVYATALLRELFASATNEKSGTD